MGFIGHFEKFPAMTLRKRLGRPVYCGWAWCGWSECGEAGEWLGVYQQRRRRLGTWKWGERIKTKQENFFQAPTWPIQPPSEARDIQQGKFKVALAAWQGLTEEQKAWYRKTANRRSRRGFDYFMTNYLKSS